MNRELIQTSPEGLRPAGKRKKTLGRNLQMHLMLVAPVLLTLLFCYLPMIGIVIAFQDYLGGQGWYVFGSDWVGLKHFERLFSDPQVWQVIRNTVVIALGKMVTGMIFPVVIAIMLSELRHLWYKKIVQVVIFFPYFISWVVMAGVIRQTFLLDGGLIPEFFGRLNMGFPDLMGDPKWFPLMLIVTNLWKDAGYGIIIFVAAILTLDPSLYEAAEIDGAGHFKRCIHITLPGILPIWVMMAVLNMGNVLNAGFDQVYNLYSDVVFSTGDILDTYVYRQGIQGGATSYSTAVGLFKSVVSLIFVAGTYYASYKAFDYKIF